MGFLDELKRQADALRAQQATDHAASERNQSLTEAACHTAQQYLMALAPQLDTLRPVSAARFVLDRQHVLERLPMSDFRVDARKSGHGASQRTDSIVMHWQLKSGRALDIRKDFVPDIEAIEPRLVQCGTPVDKKSVRDPDSGKLKAMRYRLLGDVVAHLRLTPDHRSATLHVEARNLDGLETLHCDLPATEFGSQRLDELARWLVGQPSRFLDGVQNLRRVVA